MRFLWVLGFLALSPCVFAGSEPTIKATECYKKHMEFYPDAARALSECVDANRILAVMEMPVMKGLTPMKTFLDRKFDKANYYAHELFGNAIFQSYDSGYWPNRMTKPGLYMVSRRISWWTRAKTGESIRTSFYVILNVDLGTKDVRIIETKTLTDVGI